MAVRVNRLRANDVKLALAGHARRGPQGGPEFVFLHLRGTGRAHLGNRPKNGLDWRRRRAIGVSLTRKSAISFAER